MYGTQGSYRESVQGGIPLTDRPPRSPGAPGPGRSGRTTPRESQLGRHAGAEMDGRGPCGQRSTSGGLVGRARPDRQHRDETPTTAMITSPCRQPRRSMARMVTGAAAHTDMPMPSSIQHCESGPGSGTSRTARLPTGAFTVRQVAARRTRARPPPPPTGGTTCR